MLYNCKLFYWLYRVVTRCDVVEFMPFGEVLNIATYLFLYKIIIA